MEKPEPGKGQTIHFYQSRFCWMNEGGGEGLPEEAVGWGCWLVRPLSSLGLSPFLVTAWQNLEGLVSSKQ